MKIVHLVPWSFLSADDGGRIKSASLASALAACGDLHVVDLSRRPWEGRFLGGERLALPFGGEASFWSCMPQRDPIHGLLRRIRSQRLRAGTRLARQLAADIVVADDISTLTAALAVKSGSVVAHTHNVESVLHDDLTDAAPRLARRQRARAKFYATLEQHRMPQADEVWGVRDSDLAHYRSLGIERVRLIPNTLPEERFAVPTIGQHGRALFFGSLWWAPNREALQYLVQLVQRLAASRAVEGLSLKVAGRGEADSIPSLPIEMLGFVPDLKALARDAAVVLIPILSGGGTKIKTIEALALGKPVVTTPEGAAGLDLVDGVHARVCAPGPAFDAAAIEVLNHPERFAAMAAEGQAWVRECFGQATLDRAVRAGIDAVMSRRRER